MNATVKMFMKYKKDWLISLAKDMNLDTTGNKIDIANRIASEYSKQMSRTWDVISGKENLNGKDEAFKKTNGNYQQIDEFSNEFGNLRNH